MCTLPPLMGWFLRDAVAWSRRSCQGCRHLSIRICLFENRRFPRFSLFFSVSSGPVSVVLLSWIPVSFASLCILPGPYSIFLCIELASLPSPGLRILELWLFSGRGRHDSLSLSHRKSLSLRWKTDPGSLHRFLPVGSPEHFPVAPLRYRLHLLHPLLCFVGRLRSISVHWRFFRCLPWTSNRRPGRTLRS